MSFHWPHLLWLLVVPLAAVLPVWRRSSLASRDDHPKIRRATTAADGIVESPETPGLKRSRYGLLWLALALGILALARPQWGEIDEPTFSTSREIIVALDLSRSMNATDVAPSRLERARLLTRTLLDSLKGERVGLVVFAGSAFLQSPLSADYEILEEFLPELNPGYLPEGGTNYAALLETSLDAFSKEGGAQRFLIVLSDGEATDDSWQPMLAELRKQEVRVLGIGIGTEQGAMIPDGAGGFVKDRFGAVVLSKLAPRTLQQLAEGTSGLYANAATWIELPQMIRESIEKGAAGKFEETSKKRRVERFVLFLAPAFLLVLVSLVREFPPPPPSARALRRPVPKHPAATAARVAVLAAIFATVNDEVRAEGPSAPAGDPAAAPLVALSRNLSGLQAVPPKEWDRFARMTLDYARRRTEGRGHVSKQAIRDALAAVAQGEAEAPAAAPWQELRDQLEPYLKPSPTPTPPPSPTPSQQDKQQQQNPQDGQQPSPPPDGQPQPKDSNPKEGQDGNSPRDQEEKKENSERPTPAPSRPETQKVGGAPKRPAPTPVDPRLAAPQQKLDQLRSQDKPLELLKQINRQPQKEKEVEKDW